jgi:hypothetical protein
MEMGKPGEVFIDSLSVRHVRKKRLESILGSNIAEIYSMLLGIKLLFARYN